MQTGCESERPENAGRDQGRDNRGRFRRGHSGNRQGKPAGTRHKATLAAEAMLDDQAEVLTQRAIELALAGDLVALRLCLDRILPPRRDRPLIGMQATIDGSQSLPAVTGRIVESVMSGDLSPIDAAELAKLVEVHRSAIETADLAVRIERLEGVRQRNA